MHRQRGAGVMSAVDGQALNLAGRSGSLQPLGIAKGHHGVVGAMHQ